MKLEWRTKSEESLRKFAKSERMLIVTIMVIVGFMSGVLSNTGTAAVLIPVVIGIAAKSGYKRSRLLMPLVFAAAMGGNLSLIGAPGNLIAQSALKNINLSFGFFEYAIVGLPIFNCRYYLFMQRSALRFFQIRKHQPMMIVYLINSRISAIFQNGNRFYLW